IPLPTSPALPHAAPTNTATFLPIHLSARHARFVHDVPARAADSSHIAHKANLYTVDKVSVAPRRKRLLGILNTQNALSLAFPHNSSARITQASRLETSRLRTSRSSLEPPFLGYDVRSLTDSSRGTRLPQDSSRQFKVLLTTGLVLFFAGCLLLVVLPAHKSLIALRCLGLLFLGTAGLRNRSLTFWIFFAMLAGLELGLDSPAFATQLRVLSDIFLRLIKVIVAPLILGTLITGIAGHGDLRKIGRIGWKSLVYFEAVTTIALFLGVAAINLTKAGEGLVIPATASAQSAPEVTPLRWTDFLLHI